METWTKTKNENEAKSFLNVVKRHILKVHWMDWVINLEVLRRMTNMNKVCK